MEELDTDTVHAAAKGEQKAFRQFYDHYAPFVWRVVYRAADGDRDCAAQVTQDVFVRAHRALAKFDSRSTVSTWLYRIAYNSAMTTVGRQRERWKRETAEAGETADPVSTAGQAEARDMVRRILAGLTPDERFLLTAREVDGMSYEELEAVTGVSSGALRTRLSRIKESIREGGGHADQ